MSRAVTCAPPTAATAPTIAQYQCVPMSSVPATPARSAATPTVAVISHATGPIGGACRDGRRHDPRRERTSAVVTSRLHSTLLTPTSSTSPNVAAVAGKLAHAPAANTVNNAPGGCHCARYANKVTAAAITATTTTLTTGGADSADSSVPSSIDRTRMPPAVVCIRTRVRGGSSRPYSAAKAPNDA